MSFYSDYEKKKNKNKKEKKGPGQPDIRGGAYIIDGGLMLCNINVFWSICPKRYCEK